MRRNTKLAADRALVEAETARDAEASARHGQIVAEATQRLDEYAIDGLVERRDRAVAATLDLG